MVRGHIELDAAADLTHREEHREDTIKENVRLAKDRAIKLDVAVNTKLCTLAGMKVTLVGKDGKKGQTLECLKAQFWARVTGRGWTCPGIGAAYRSEHTRKLKLKSQEGQDEIKRLTTLLTLMIAEDKKHKRKVHAHSYAAGTCEGSAVDIHIATRQGSG